MCFCVKICKKEKGCAKKNQKRQGATSRRCITIHSPTLPLPAHLARINLVALDLAVNIHHHDACCSSRRVGIVRVRARPSGHNDRRCARGGRVRNVREGKRGILALYFSNDFMIFKADVETLHTPASQLGACVAYTCFCFIVPQTDFPKFFDLRNTWWGCGVTTHNQGQCGSCWASSAISVLNDRFCIHKDINDDPLDVSRYGAGAINRAFMDAGSCDKVSEGRRCSVVLFGESFSSYGGMMHFTCYTWDHMVRDVAQIYALHKFIILERCAIYVYLLMVFNLLLFFYAGQQPAPRPRLHQAHHYFVSPAPCLVRQHDRLPEDLFGTCK